MTVSVSTLVGEVKITADEKALNELALLFWLADVGALERSLPECAVEARCIFRSIFNDLDIIGYYDIAEKYPDIIKEEKFNECD